MWVSVKRFSLKVTVSTVRDRVLGSGSGGMRMVASARMIDSKARKSAASLASTYFFSRSRSAALASTVAGHPGLCDGRRSQSVTNSELAIRKLHCWVNI